ncbi:hypothetical protein AL542_04560 [Grimontia hollisae]|nr:hypothetical protein AL542_04560 [Grimontia hollisae]
MFKAPSPVVIGAFLFFNEALFTKRYISPNIFYQLYSFVIFFLALACFFYSCWQIELKMK